MTGNDGIRCEKGGTRLLLVLILSLPKEYFFNGYIAKPKPTKSVLSDCLLYTLPLDPTRPRTQSVYQQRVTALGSVVVRTPSYVLSALEYPFVWCLHRLLRTQPQLRGLRAEIVELGRWAFHSKSLLLRWHNCASRCSSLILSNFNQVSPESSRQEVASSEDIGGHFSEIIQHFHIRE